MFMPWVTTCRPTNATEAEPWPLTALGILWFPDVTEEPKTAARQQ